MSNETTTESQTTAKTQSVDHSLFDNWKDRLEELLKAKNLDDVKSELNKLATDLQKEIQSFDLNAHLSPSARQRVKQLEKRYNEVLRSLHKAQRQFDREFNKTIRLVKKTRTDAEKQLTKFKKKFGQQKTKLKKVVKKKATRKKTARKTTTRRATNKK